MGKVESQIQTRSFLRRQYILGKLPEEATDVVGAMIAEDAPITYDEIERAKSEVDDIPKSLSGIHTRVESLISKLEEKTDEMFPEEQDLFSAFEDQKRAFLKLKQAFEDKLVSPGKECVVNCPRFPNNCICPKE